MQDSDQRAHTRRCTRSPRERCWRWSSLRRCWPVAGATNAGDGCGGAGGCDVRIRYVDLNSMQTHYAFFHTSLEISPVTNQMHWVCDVAIAQ
jgi:hypothetical protein